MPPTNSSAHPKGLHRGTQRAACFPTRTGLPFASRNWKWSGACRVWLIWVSGPGGPQAPEAERKNWGSGVIKIYIKKNVVNSTRLFRILEHFHSDMLLRWPTVLFNLSIITTIIRSSRSSITTPSPIPSPSLNPKSKT